VRLLHPLAKSVGVAALLAGVLGAAPASAAPVQLYSATTTGLTNMTHQNAYVWNLNGVNTTNGGNIGVLPGSTLTSAVLTFFNFANWTTAALDPYNVLWVDLFNSAATGRNGNNQVSSITDNTNGSTLGKTDVLDGFRYAVGTNVSALSAVNGTGVYLGSSTNTALAAGTPVTGYDPSGTADALGNNQPLTGGTGAFSTTAVTWTLTITDASVLATLANYISNGGDIALGLDSDCHFSDTSIQFQIFGNQPSGGGASAVPEPATLMLVGSGIAAAYRRRRKTIAA
jgi:hypothetical protein